MKKVKSINVFVFLIVLLILLIGVTYAFFNLIITQKEDSTKIYTGSMAIEYIDGNEINNPKLFPIEEPKNNDYSKAYVKMFKVYSSGEFDQKLNIYLNVTSNSFSNNSIKYSLYNNKNVKLTSGNISSIGKIEIASNIKLIKNTKEEYKLLIWLSEKYNNQNMDQGKTITATINLNSVQYTK